MCWQVLGKDLFNTMREKHGLAGFEELIQEKIVPLAGDIGIQNFGLDRSTVDDLCEEIDVIIHGAATTSFYERYNNYYIHSLQSAREIVFIVKNICLTNGDSF